MSKYKVGDKFIIEIDYVLNDRGREFYGIKGTDTMVFTVFGLDMFRRYVSPCEQLLKELKSATAFIQEMLEKEKEKEEHDGCVGCEHENLPENNYPCSVCKHSYIDKWRAKK